MLRFTLLIVLNSIFFIATYAHADIPVGSCGFQSTGIYKGYCSEGGMLCEAYSSLGTDDQNNTAASNNCAACMATCPDETEIEEEPIDEETNVETLIAPQVPGERSKEMDIEGCTDSLAINFDSTATLDDGNCYYYEDPIAMLPGCTDSTANNYDFAATADDGSCIYDDEVSANDTFADDAITDISGCTIPEASNYNSFATLDDGNCTYFIDGCTDPMADNYNSFAVYDDGSCTY